MTEEQKEQPDVEERAAPEQVGPVEAGASAPVEESAQAEEGAQVEESASTQQPAEGRKTSWPVVVGVIAAILALCAVVVCAAAGIATYSGTRAAPAPPTPAPIPTQAPPGALIVITEPDQGQVVDIDRPVEVRGRGIGLPEGNVVVEALDWEGNLLAQQPATLKGPDVGIGGEGTWSTKLTIEAEPGTAGKIRAFSPSPKDGSTIAQDVVDVSLGRTAVVEAYIQIDEPDQGAVLDIAKPVTVRGSGAGLPEGNVVVEALDRGDNVLDRQPTTLQGRDVGAGGEGTWSVELTIEAEAGTAGEIRAFSPSPQDGSVIAEDSVEVSLGSTPAVESYLKIGQPDQGTTLDVTELVQVSGTGAGLPEGNVVVVAVDEEGDVLAEQATTLQGSEVGTGGEGTWSVELAVPASGQTPGYIAAFSASPKGRSLVASDRVEVIFSGELTLEGTTWVLGGTMLDSEITAEFADGAPSGDGEVSGSSGCNTYTGTYASTRAAGKNTIRIGPLASTMMACDEPVMNQEGLYLAALEAATEYTIEGFSLSIAYPGGTLLFYDQDGPRPRR